MDEQAYHAAVYERHQEEAARRVRALIDHFLLLDPADEVEDDSVEPLPTVPVLAWRRERD